MKVKLIGKKLETYNTYVCVIDQYEKSRLALATLLYN